MRLVIALLWLTTFPASVSAHQKSVSYSKWTILDDGAVGQVRVRWLELTSLPDGLGSAIPYLQRHLTLESDAGPCEALESSVVELPADEGWLRVEWRVRCEGSPSQIRSSLFSSLTNHVHLATARGDSQLDVVLSPTAPAASLRDRGGPARGIGGYLRLGVEHILTGWDHLAFLFLLIVVAGRLRDVAILVTGFTVGHSVTLGAAALGFVVPNVRAVEATIAASILIVALENAGMERVRGGRLVLLGALGLFVACAVFGALPAFWGVALFTACYFALLRAIEWRTRLRWVIACLFGFVHGLGFSGALLEQELPRGELVSALFGFNVGVELGQLVVVAVAWPMLQWLRKRNWESRVVDATSFGGAIVGTCALVLRAFS